MPAIVKRDFVTRFMELANYFAIGCVLAAFLILFSVYIAGMINSYSSKIINKKDQKYHSFLFKISGGVTTVYRRYIDEQMKMILCLTGLVFMVLFVAGQQDSDIVAKNAKPQLISSVFSFTEGPASDGAGNVYFTDQPNNKIWKYDTAGNLSVFMDKAGRSNGMYFDKKGNLITCADEEDQLWSISPAGKVKVLLRDFKGHRFNGPNDCWIDANGGIYFTDPYYQRDYWVRQMPDPGINGQKLYYLPSGKKEAVMVDADFTRPNGIVGTPDNKYLYVSDIGKNKILRYRISGKGVLKDRIDFIADTSDGMTLDVRGNLYLAGHGITVYNPSGKKIKHIDVPSGWTANLCFGGKNKDILFITASESFFILPMLVKGVK